jgi:hypothetical protein
MKNMENKNKIYIFLYLFIQDILIFKSFDKTKKKNKFIIYLILIIKQ